MAVGPTCAPCACRALYVRGQADNAHEHQWALLAAHRRGALGQLHCATTSKGSQKERKAAAARTWAHQQGPHTTKSKANEPGGGGPGTAAAGPAAASGCGATCRARENHGAHARYPRPWPHATGNRAHSRRNPKWKEKECIYSQKHATQSEVAKQALASTPLVSRLVMPQGKCWGLHPWPSPSAQKRAPNCPHLQTCLNHPPRRTEVRPTSSQHRSGHHGPRNVCTQRRRHEVPQTPEEAEQACQEPS